MKPVSNLPIISTSSMKMQIKRAGNGRQNRICMHMVYIHKMIQNIGYHYPVIILIDHNKEQENLPHKDINKMEKFYRHVQFISQAPTRT